MKTSTSPHETMSRDAILIGRILESFEAMEDTLSGLNLEEPLFITRVAKKAFAEAVFKAPRRFLKHPGKSAKLPPQTPVCNKILF